MPSQKPNLNRPQRKPRKTRRGNSGSDTRADARGHLLTEQRNPNSHDLDAISVAAAFDLMNAEDATVPLAVRKAKRPIVEAIKCVSAAWKAGGRLIYVGAGTSGRLGVIDAAECPPTFRSDPKMVHGVIAGGHKALWRSVEGAEDDPAVARSTLAELSVNRRDVVMGIATGGTTPYVHAALAKAKKHHAATIFLACVPKSQVPADCDIDIRVLTGPEILSGSTRLKAGTATKLVLNTITTLSMVQLGKTYSNLMIDLNSFACRKLTDRATCLIATLTNLTHDKAGLLLRAAGGRVKTALIMHRRGMTRRAADQLLNEHDGRVREALQSTPQGHSTPTRHRKRRN